MLVNNRRRKILVYLYNRDGTATGAALRAKFGDDIVALLALFIRGNFMYAQNADESFVLSNSQDADFATFTPETKFHLTSQASTLIEDHRRKLWMWGVPLTFSALAFLISLVNLGLKLAEMFFNCG